MPCRASPPVGYMSAKACSSGQNFLNLWAINADRQLFKISGFGTGLPLGINVTFMNVGRASEGCASYLSVAAAAGQCSNNKVQLGSQTSLGATFWEIKNVPGQPGYVYITNAVRRPGGVFEGVVWVWGVSRVMVVVRGRGGESLRVAIHMQIALIPRTHPTLPYRSAALPAACSTSAPVPHATTPSWAFTALGTPTPSSSGSSSRARRRMVFDQPLPPPLPPQIL